MTRKVPASTRVVLTQAVNAAGRFNDLKLGVVAGAEEQTQLDGLHALIWQAWMVEATTPRTHKESVDLMRIGSDEVSPSPTASAWVRRCLTA